MLLKCAGIELNLCFVTSPGSNDGGLPEEADRQKSTYDVSKLVDFPGFNVPAQHSMKDVSV